MTTYIIGNLFLTTNEFLFINNHVFVKLLEYPHIKNPKSALSLSLSFIVFLSPLFSLPNLHLSLSPIALSLTDLPLSRRGGQTIAKLRRASGPRPDGMAKVVRSLAVGSSHEPATTMNDQAMPRWGSCGAGSSATGWSNNQVSSGSQVCQRCGLQKSQTKNLTLI